MPVESEPIPVPTSGNLMETAVAPAADILMYIVFFTFSEPLIQMFSENSMANLLLIPGIYLAMCGGIALSKRLEWHPGNDGKISTFAAVTAWFFSVFVVVMALDTAGVFKSGSAAGSVLDKITESGWLQLLVIPVYLLILVLFPLLTLKKPSPRIPFGSLRHALSKLTVILLINTMTLITAVYWEWQMMDADPMEVAWMGKLLILGVSYPVFLLFYAPPRLALLNLEKNRWSMTLYLVFLGIMIWRFL